MPYAPALQRFAYMAWSSTTKVVIKAYSSYSRDIYPPIAATVALNEELYMKRKNGGKVPPMVDVIANSLYVYEGKQRNDQYGNKNRWILVEKGTILVKKA